LFENDREGKKLDGHINHRITMNNKYDGNYKCRISRKCLLWNAACTSDEPHSKGMN